MRRTRLVTRLHSAGMLTHQMLGRCLAEFLKWSIKQATKRQMANDPVNVGALVKRLTMLGRHPRAYLRLGGALAFNHLYTTFREVGRRWWCPRMYHVLACSNLTPAVRACSCRKPPS